MNTPIAVGPKGSAKDPTALPTQTSGTAGQTSPVVADAWLTAMLMVGLEVKSGTSPQQASTGHGGSEGAAVARLRASTSAANASQIGAKGVVTRASHSTLGHGAASQLLPATSANTVLSRSQAAVKPAGTTHAVQIAGGSLLPVVGDRSDAKKSDAKTLSALTSRRGIGAPLPASQTTTSAKPGGTTEINWSDVSSLRYTPHAATVAPPLDAQALAVLRQAQLAQQTNRIDTRTEAISGGTASATVQPGAIATSLAATETARPDPSTAATAVVVGQALTMPKAATNAAKTTLSELKPGGTAGRTAGSIPVASTAASTTATAAQTMPTGVIRPVQHATREKDHDSVRRATSVRGTGATATPTANVETVRLHTPTDQTNVDGSGQTHTPATLQLDDSAWATRLAQTVANHVAAGQGQLTVHVHPEGLGDLVITAVRQHDGISVHLEASNASVASLLTQASGDIRDTVRAQGVDVSGVAVSFAQTSFAGGGQGGGQGGQFGYAGQQFASMRPFTQDGWTDGGGSSERTAQRVVSSASRGNSLINVRA